MPLVLLHMPLIFIYLFLFKCTFHQSNQIVKRNLLVAKFRVLDVNSIFKIKNLNFIIGFKNMIKLVRVGTG